MCLIWAGDADSMTANAFLTVKHISTELFNASFVNADYIGYPGDPYSALIDQNGIYVGLPRSLVSPPVFFEGFSIPAAMEFFSRPLFHRIWVVQETVLAPDVVCHSGPYQVPWKDICLVACWFRYAQSSLQFGTRQTTLDGFRMPIFSGVLINDLKQQKQASNEEVSNHCSITSLLAFSQKLHASDPKDLFDGMIGLFRELKMGKENLLALEVDYNKSVAAVFIDATVAAINEHGDLDVLRLVDSQVELQGKPGLPSWVPQWDQYSSGEIVLGENETRRFDGIVDLDLLQQCGQAEWVLLRGF